MADFNNIKQQTRNVIYDNENGGITSSALRQLILDIIDEINDKKADKASPDQTIYNTPVISECSYKYGTISGNGGTISKSDFEVSYSQSWTKNGEEQTPITSGGSVTISLSQSSGFGNSVNIQPNTTGNTRQVNIYIKVTLNGKISAPQLVQVQQDVIHTDKLIYAEIPITDADLDDILANTKDMSYYVTSQAIQNNISDTINGYIIDDNNPSTANDEYQLNTQEHGIFLSVFLLSNTNHSVVQINPLTNQQEQITGEYPQKIYQNNNYQYNGEQYKVLAVIQLSNQNISLKIQIKNS